MGRKWFVVLVVCIMFVVTGCGQEDNTPLELRKAVNRTESELALQYTKSDDSTFWSSAQTAANLISNTIEKGREYQIDILMETSDGTSFVVERFSKVTYINDAWRDLCRNQVLIDLASSSEVDAIHQAGESVEIVGTIMSYLDFSEEGVFNGTIELQDLDNDGIWDSDDLP